MFALAWVFGSWHTGVAVAQTIVLGLMALVLVGLIVAGWLEWRGRKRPDG